MSEWVQRGVGSVLALAGHVTVVFFLVFFLLISGGHFRKRIVEMAGTRMERRQITATIIDDINAQIQRFLLVRIVTAAVVALATWMVLAWMGVVHAAVWGILTGVFNSIPYFGPIIVSGGLLLVGLVQSGDLMQAIKISGAALVITSLEGWLLTPPLLGKMTGALAIWVLARLVLPSGVAALLVFGLYAGYNYFALVHHLQHHRAKDLARVAYLRRLERLHDTHHHRQGVNYGISTTMWDRLLGTFQPTTEPATDYFFWSTIRSYWMRLTRKPSATS